MSHFTQILPSLYRFKDLVNVYVIVRNNRALAIELGRARVLNHLSELGVDQLDWVLHTHHHRDLCLGDSKAVQMGAELAVPAAEAAHFADAETHWRDWYIYVNYDLRNRYDALRESVPVSAELIPGESFTWEDLEFRILETPGHTAGSASLLLDLDGKTLCFCGDTISAPGKVPTIHDLHWGYMPPGSGIPELSKSLESILGESPDILLPTRGEQMDDPAEAIGLLQEKLQTVENHLKPNHGGRKDQGLHQVNEHIWFLGCTSYCIMLPNGHGLVWDYGYVPRESIDTLRRDHGLKHIDAVAVSHYHDDHVCRIPELVHTVCRNQEPRPEVWVFENQAEIYTDPTRFNIPCLWPTAIPHDRVVADGEVVDWHGARLEFFYMPGQTDWHCGMVADVENKRYAFTGDNLWKPGDPDRLPNGPVIWRNRQILDGGTLLGFRKLRELSPDVILPAHTDPVEPVTPEYLDAIVSWAEQIKPMMKDLIDQPDPEFGCDCFWTHFHPYRRILSASTTSFKARIILRNHHDHEAALKLTPALPTGWSSVPATIETTVAAKFDNTFEFAITPIALEPTQRHVLSVNVTLNETDHGERSEMIIDVE